MDYSIYDLHEQNSLLQQGREYRLVYVVHCLHCHTNLIPRVQHNGIDANMPSSFGCMKPYNEVHPHNSPTISITHEELVIH